MGGDRETLGDPLNLALVGDGRHVLAALVRNGWDLTETMRRDTAWRTVASSVFGTYYRTSPVSPLYLFGRSQDFALQKARHTVNERNHLRLWLAPVTLDGQNVWVGQISRDIGVKFRCGFRPFLRDQCQCGLSVEQVYRYCTRLPDVRRRLRG